MSKEILARVNIPGIGPQQVWPLLSSAPALGRWFCEHAEVDLPAGRFNFWGSLTPDTPARGAGHLRLRDWSEPETGTGEGGAIAFDWFLRGQQTGVTISLAPSADGTEVAVQHSALGERLTSKGAVHDFWYTVLENLRLLALTGRGQALPEYGPKPASSLMVQVDISAPPAEIFRCLIEPAWMAKLWNDESIKVEPMPGGIYDYGWKEGGPRHIVQIDAPRLLSFTWVYPPETQETLVTWRLDEIGDGLTRLSLTHSGFAPDYDDEEYRAGWFSFLAIIKGICELGDRWQRVSIKGIAHGEA
jgi:uncharacterized protein YndB with AHSA1/START domain